MERYHVHRVKHFFVVMLLIFKYNREKKTIKQRIIFDIVVGFTQMYELQSMYNQCSNTKILYIMSIKKMFRNGYGTEFNSKRRST